MSGTFLQKSRHQTVYYFRRKIPVDLRSRVGATQILTTLHTQSRQDAVILARRLAVRSDELFRIIRSMSDSDFKDTPLGRLITERKTVAPLKEEIDALRDQLVDAEFQRRKEIGQIQEEHRKQLAAVAGGVDTKEPLSVVLSAAACTTPSLTVDQAITELLADPSIKPKTRSRYRSALDNFKEFVGASTALSAISQPRFADYAQTISGKAGWAGATKKLYITMAARLFRWANSRHSNIPNISTIGLIQKRQSPANQDRGAFTLDDIGALFTHVAKFKADKPHQFWVTVAIAFTGCRLQEIAQLDLASDFAFDEESATWFISVNENAGPSGHKKSVKTLAGWRTIPIHPALVRHGLIEFFKAEQKAGAKTPFGRYWKPLPTDEADRFDFAHQITRWGTDTLKKLKTAKIITTPKVAYFHSLRHSFSNHLARNGVAEEIRCAILGQEYGGINSTVYTKLKQEIGPKTATIEGNLVEYTALLDACLAK